MARAQRDLDLGPFEWSRKAGNKRCEAKGKEIMAMHLGGQRPGNNDTAPFLFQADYNYWPR